MRECSPLDLVLRSCVYCGRPLGTDRSKEHGLPAAMGGKVEGDNPLLVDAHQRCNNNVGRLVDARFARSWFGLVPCLADLSAGRY